MIFVCVCVFVCMQIYDIANDIECTLCAPNACRMSYVVYRK